MTLYIVCTAPLRLPDFSDLRTYMSVSFLVLALSPTILAAVLAETPRITPWANLYETQP